MADEQPESVLFTYLAPFVGVLLVAVGIGAAVPGGYALIQGDIAGCGDPSIAVESPEETAGQFGNATSPNLARFQYEELSSAEQTAFTEAIDDPVGEAKVKGEFPHAAEFRNGSIVTYEGEQRYVTVVAEHPCYAAAPLQFPLGVFAIAFGTLAILSPPIYRRMVALEEQAE
ncbi:hypothetical protein [Haloarcula nitratireducens]|uniref:DUF7979 domain-containing protein n=1 Tax=Haloarcula nitratireducens TaxID=2487749 RepID=A0AAW4P8C9_9EURY|nr:hypothetical protein [Halomicroarcula nitratireducens]MBX0294306.1 hypothetical protein [Halomicroarcula nitratireducens]